MCCLLCRRSKGPEATRLWSAALPILYAIFSALIGTQSVLFSKTLAVLLRSTVAGDNQVWTEDTTGQTEQAICQMWPSKSLGGNDHSSRAVLSVWEV